jgi:predicted dehydrogenase
MSFPSVLPVSRFPDPMAAPPLRWGVIGTGGIAQVFIAALHRHTRQKVVAIGSRTSDRAAAFAQANGVERSHGSYEALVADPGIDAVYVASPHSEHRAHALLAIAAGRHVLVEKSFTRSASEAGEVVAAARAAGITAMEAMWTRFLPQSDVIRQLIDDGVFGEIRTVIADHGQYFAPDPRHRLFAPELAGGALLDLGIYPVSFAHFVLGAPEQINAVGELTNTGVDAQVSAILRTGPAHAVLNTTLAARTPTTASISGDAALLEVSGPFYAPASFALEDVSRGRRLQRPVDAIAGPLGLCHEAAHFATLVADGAAESPLLPLDETVAIMATLDTIRDQIAMVLPGE